MGKKTQARIREMEELAKAAEGAGDDCRGRSIVEMMEDELDSIVERLMTPGAAAEDGRDPGRAEGVAFCIAIIRQPYNPDIEAVRNDAMLRWEEKEES